MVNPATGEIQVVQFKGGNPVDEAAYNQLLSNGFYVQGSDALAMAKQEASRGPEDDYDITTGSKPFNKMTVGELAWTMSRQSYNGAFPDSLSAGAERLVGMSPISKGVGSLLGNIPSELEIAISTAEKRLANDQFSNAKEKTMLEAMAALKGKPAKTVYKAMYDLTGVHLGASGKGFKRDIRVKDFSNYSSYSDPDFKIDTATSNFKDGTFAADEQEDQLASDRLATGKGTDADKAAEAKRLSDYAAVIKKMNEDNNNDNDNNQNGGSVTTGESTVQEVKDFKKDFEEAGGTWASGGRAKGGLINKRKKKK
tara:strand:- start:500 stop:1432 length:933 start_codon:yes stop_codon:yes gene_type:complete